MACSPTRVCAIRNRTSRRRRALYLRNRVRAIASTDYRPSPILSAMLDDGSPLDLSMHGLSSVSPVHLEYMRNMGMAASMLVSVIVDGRLWGLIACHHRAPRQLPPRHRTAADLLGVFYSMRVAAMQHLETATRKTRAGAIRMGMRRMLGAIPDPSAYIATLLPELREMIPADAVVLVSPAGIAGVAMPFRTRSWPMRVHGWRASRIRWRHRPSPANGRRALPARAMTGCSGCA